MDTRTKPDDTLQAPEHGRASDTPGQSQNDWFLKQKTNFKLGTILTFNMGH